MVRQRLQELSDDAAVAGVMLQLPLPTGIELAAVIEALDPGKDLDGIHPFNAGLVSRGGGGFAPSRAEAAVQILKRSRIPLAGRPAVVFGRSNVVGRPVQPLLIGGTNVLAGGTVVSAVDLPSVLPIAAAVTPVPGGVGPVTDAVLMRHLVRAARSQPVSGSPAAAEVAS